MELYQKRWQKARELMAQKGIDALLLPLPPTLPT